MHGTRYRNVTKLFTSFEMLKHTVENTKIVYVLNHGIFAAPTTDLTNYTIKDLVARDLAEFMEGEPVAINCPGLVQGGLYRCNRPLLVHDLAGLVQKSDSVDWRPAMHRE